MRHRHWWFVGLAAVMMVQLAAPAWALNAASVLVLYNAADANSQSIADYYAVAHPGVRLLGLTNIPSGEQITATAYLDVIRSQVLAGLDSSIDCIVTTKGLPLRIYNPGYSNRYSSLESELARVDSIGTRSLMGSQSYWNAGSLARNPYYQATGPFSRAVYGTRLTARLDGFTVADVQQSIDRAAKAVVGRPKTWMVLDCDPNWPVDRMVELAAVLDQQGQPYVIDQTAAFVRTAPGGVLVYVTHGLYGGAPSGYLVDPGIGIQFDLLPGALFHSWESYNAYSFNVGGNRSGQPLVAEWLARGGTVGLGHVEEPGVSVYSVANEDWAVNMLLAGYTWAEAAWSAHLQVSFVNTVVGDPLMVVHQWIEGDVDLDGDVDLFDISAVKVAYGSSVGSPRYNPYCDMNASGAVDLWDLMFVKTHYTGPVCQYPPPP